MNSILPLQFVPQRERSYLLTTLGILLFAWICMMFASANLASGSAEGIRNVFIAALLLVAATGAIQMKSLSRAGEFFGKQPMPNALWRAWMRACILESSLIWVVLSAAMSALLATRSSTLPWPEGAALISSTLSLGAIAVRQHRSMMAKGRRWLATAAGCAIVLTLFGLGASRIFAAVAAWPLPVLWLLTLSWPALAASLILDRTMTPDALREVPSAVRRPRPATWKSDLGRLSPLDATSWKLTIGAAQRHRTGARVGWLLYLALPIYFYFVDVKPLGWNDAADARNLVSIAAFGLAMTLSLMVRDLHWRSMLLPGGWRHGRIASDIFSATLKVQYAMLAAAAIFYLCFAHFADGIGVDAVLQTIANHTLMLATVPFAISVALVIRALPRFNRAKCWMALFLCACWLYLRFVVGYANLPRWHANGLTYAVLLTGMTWPTLWLANRMWTAEKLIACARGPAQQ